MGNAIVAVSPFTAEDDFAILAIEYGAPLDKLADVRGRFTNHHLDDVRIAQIAAGR